MIENEAAPAQPGSLLRHRCAAEFATRHMDGQTEA